MKKNFKTSYSVHHKFESFFTGSQIQFEQSGEHFYCAYGPQIHKVSANDGQVKAVIKCSHEEDTVLQFVLARGDQLIIIAYQSELIVKFNLLEESVEREFRSIHNAPISILKVNPSGTLLATGSSDSTIKLWNLNNHFCSHNLKGINGITTCIEFLEIDDGGYLFASAGDDCIHVFCLKTSKRICKLSTHCSTITGLILSSNKRRLISVGRDKIAVVWDISNHAEKQFGPAIRTIPLFEGVESVAILNNEEISDVVGLSMDDDDRVFFATIGEQGVIKFWDSVTGAKIAGQDESGLSKDRCPGTFSIQLVKRPAHNQICAVSTERDIFIYELPRLDLVQQLQGHIDEVLSACWLANDKYIALACNSNDLKVLEVSSSKCQHLKGHSDIVLCVKQVTTDPFCLISSSKDCTIIVWKFEPDNMKSSIIFRGTGHTHAIHSLGVLQSALVFISGSEDTTIKKWSISLDKIEKGKIGSIVASKTVKAHDNRIDDIAISPNDELLVTASRDKTAKVFSVDGLQLLGTLKGHKRGVRSVQFSPVDQVIVTAADTNLRIWNIADFSCVRTLQGHDCAVLNFTFLNTGLQAISAGSDGNMKLWDIRSGECMKTIDAHEGNTWALAMTCDNNLMVTGGEDQKVAIWKDTTAEEYEEKLVNLQNQVKQEQDFVNYINKKKWRKALKLAIAMENQAKVLNVLREILLDQDGLEELKTILLRAQSDSLDFIGECCVTWNASAKNSSIAQTVLNIIFNQMKSEEIMKLSRFMRSLDQLRTLTEKSFNRYERLVQQSTFVDFFMNSIKIQ